MLCLASYCQFNFGDYLVVPVICVLTVSALLSYLENPKVSLAGFLLLCAVSVRYPVFLYFLPLLAYDMYMTRYRYMVITALIPFAAAVPSTPPLASVFILLFTGLSYLTRLRTKSFEETRGEYFAFRDASKELSLQLERKNRDLMEKQDYEVSLATLNERNRIARDIHDSVGHILSNAILQTGALIATCRDEAERGRLNTLKETLVSGMDSIRESIHDLYDDSVDLDTEVRALADGFHFCELYLGYEIDSSPDLKTKYAFIYVIKEALSNIIRHSDATHASIILKEHPALYQLTVRDNGTKKETAGGGIQTDGGGIGLINIEQRISGLGGSVNIGYDGGFTVFVSVPKERK